jgi:hypothetical protein
VGVRAGVRWDGDGVEGGSPRSSIGAFFFSMSLFTLRCAAPSASMSLKCSSAVSETRNSRSPCRSRSWSEVEATAGPSAGAPGAGAAVAAHTHSRASSANLRVYAAALSLAGRTPVVVRASTRAVVYAFFSAAAAAAAAAASPSSAPRAKARAVMLAARRATASARAASGRDQSSLDMGAGGGNQACGRLGTRACDWWWPPGWRARAEEEKQVRVGGEGERSALSHQKTKPKINHGRPLGPRQGGARPPG